MTAILAQHQPPALPFISAHRLLSCAGPATSIGRGGEQFVLVARSLPVAWAAPGIVAGSVPVSLRSSAAADTLTLSAAVRHIRDLERLGYLGGAR